MIYKGWSSPLQMKTDWLKKWKQLEILIDILTTIDTRNQKDTENTIEIIPLKSMIINRKVNIETQEIAIIIQEGAIMELEIAIVDLSSIDIIDDLSNK